MIEASAFKRGRYVVFKGEPMEIVDVKTSTPTARGANVIVKTKLRSLTTGRMHTESIRAGEKFDEVDLEQRSSSFLYTDGDLYHFMDAESFEQFAFTAEELGEQTPYLADGLEGLRCVLIDGKPVGITLPMTVDLEVVETDPAIKGATATAQLKPAELETGLVIQVPPYLANGDRVKVDTRDGHFVERVKD